MPEEKIVVFDFDGVIGDSAYECYVQSIKALKDVGGKLEDSKKVEQKFRQARPFVKVAEDYDVVLRMIEKNPEINFDEITQADFEKAKGNFRQEFAKFKERFLASRKEMQLRDENAWYALQKDFPGVVKSLNRLAEKFKVVIGTTKDRASTSKLLKFYGANIGEEDIVSKEIFDDKTKQMKYISIKYDVPLENLVFIDDMLEQLRPVVGIGVRPVMADWGYSTKAQKEIAIKEGIPLVGQENLAGQIERIVYGNRYEKFLIYILLTIAAIIVFLWLKG